MQQMDLSAIRDFLAVARVGGMNKAASSLRASATTVGRRIEALEAGLGVHLFQRSQTGFALTDDGHELIARAGHGSRVNSKSSSMDQPLWSPIIYQHRCLSPGDLQPIHARLTAFSRSTSTGKTTAHS